jgi:hypothetical protein
MLPSPGQSLMSSFVTSSDNKYGHSNPRQKSLTNSLVSNLIVKCGLPISLVDNPDFCSFLHDIDPRYQTPCRQTVTYTLLPQLLGYKQTKLHDILECFTDLSLTADIWTDRRSHAYLGVTVHGFNGDSGIAVSHLLAFRCFSGSHTGEKIAESLDNVITECCIGSKIRSVVTDNASNMKKALTVLLDDSIAEVDDPLLWEDDVDTDIAAAITYTDCQHIGCFAHSLQLVVHDGLGSLNVARLVLSKCCKLANIVHQSALFRSSYEKVLGSGKIIPSSNETRWNSTFRQLQCIVDIDAVKLNALLRDTNHENLILSGKDLNMLQEVVKVLLPFAEATDLTQGDKTVTISCVLPIVLSVNKLLESFLLKSTILTSFINALLQSLRQRFSGLFALIGMHFHTGSSTSRAHTFNSNLFLMAAAVHPAFSYQWLNDHPGSAEEKESVRSKINGMQNQQHC